jgi:phosphopantetheine--protein transferase-like protein
MITGIGTDIVEVARFLPWVTASDKQLRTIFSAQEITDCLTPNTQQQHIAERLAARFAAKEAFYKALSATLVTLTISPAQTFSFMFAAQHVSVVVGQLGAPTLTVDWPPLYEKIGQGLPPLTINLSLAHEKNMALAFVVVSQQN